MVSVNWNLPSQNSFQKKVPLVALRGFFTACVEAAQRWLKIAARLARPQSRIILGVGYRDLSMYRLPQNVILLMAEILHQLIGRLSSYLHGFIHPWWCRISTINSIIISNSHKESVTSSGKKPMDGRIQI